MAYEERELDIRLIKFRGVWVAELLKILALLSIVGSVAYLAAGVAASNDDPTANTDVVYFGLAGGALVSGALLGAAGYGLAVLIETYAETWRLRVYSEEDEDE